MSSLVGQVTWSQVALWGGTAVLTVYATSRLQGSLTQLTTIAKDLRALSADIRATVETVREIESGDNLGKVVAFATTKSDPPSTFSWAGTYAAFRDSRDTAEIVRDIVDAPVITAAFQRSPDAPGDGHNSGGDFDGSPLLSARHHLLSRSLDESRVSLARTPAPNTIRRRNNAVGGRSDSGSASGSDGGSGSSNSSNKLETVNEVVGRAKEAAEHIKEIVRHLPTALDRADRLLSAFRPHQLAYAGIIFVLTLAMIYVTVLNWVM